jgi:aryl-alcohol dehydrogenase-like predicted oxidoreductase
MTSSPTATPHNASGPTIPGLDESSWTEDLRNSIDRSFDRTLSRLKELVAIPGIAWPSFDRAPLESSAKAVAELLRGAADG